MSDTKVKSSNLILSALNQAIIPDTNEAYDLGTAEKKFRDLYLSTGTIYMGDNSVSIDADGRLSYSRTVDGATKTSAMPEVDLNIAPEVLGIQVQANDAGDNIMWKWTWTQSSLPYSRIDITNETQLSVPLYNKGTYTIDNYAAHETYDDMTQTHKGYFKWVEGAGTDNLVSWATYTENVSTSISTINNGDATDVQRYQFTVPDSITLPTLTQPTGIGYDVSFDSTGYYTFGAYADSGEDMNSVAEGNNPTIGPLYRGSTYTFTLDSSLSSHPFYLTTDNGSNFVSGSYVSEYTTGVTGSRNDGSTGKETLTFEVDSSAPDELYYQCGTHSAMRGAITIKDLEVAQNDNDNYEIYFQHTHEGHSTKIELRPIPSLVNQMCLVYDASTGKFVPQDLATYVENTPSFKRKIQDVSGTAELVVADGSTVIAKVNVYPDSTYLPLTNINAGDQAFATDTNILYVWDGSAWQQAGASNTNDLTEGSSNLFYTTSRFDSDFGDNTTSDLTEGSNLYYTTSRFDSDFGDNTTDDLTEGSNLYYTDARSRASISGTGSLSYNSSTGVMSFTQGDTDTVSEGSTNLYYTTSRHDSDTNALLSGGTGVTYSSGTISIGQAVATTDSVTFSGLTVSGDLVVSGTTTQINTQVYTITDPLLHLADSNETSDVVDIGFVGHYNDGAKKHTGLFRDASDGKYYLFTGLQDTGLDSSTPDNIIDRAGTGYTNADLTIGNLYLNGTQITSTAAELNTLDGYTGSVTELNYLKSLYDTGVTSTEFNILDGVTATAAEINILDGVTATTSELNIMDGVTATTTELNLLDGVTATTTELNYVDGVTSNIQTQLNAKLASSSYTAADVLTKIKTVDGAGSGLDADTLDGVSSASFLRSDANDTCSGVITFSGQPYFSATGPTGGIKIHSNGGITASGNYMQFYTAQINGWRFNNNSDGSDSTNVNKFVISTSGNVTAAGEITANSDERLKSDIQTITNAVDTVKALRGCAYIKDDKASIGVIAQEIEEVLPQVVSTADDEMGTKSVAYGNIVAVLIEAIKEQQEQIDELKKLLEAK